MEKLRIQRDARLNVLLTEDRPHDPGYWIEQLPRLLEPQGVASYVARSGQEAIDLAAQLPIHAAIIDLATPIGQASRGGGKGGGAGGTGASGGSGGATGSGGAGGLWLLELFRRLPSRPPIVVVHGPSVSEREMQRLLHEALRLGAFSVLRKPVELEQVLSVFRRLLDRQYRGGWPQRGGDGDGDGEAVRRSN